MSIPDQSIECLNPNCGWCIRAEKDREAEAGLRCMGCLDLFKARYPQPSEEDPSLCNGCLRIAKAPKYPRSGMYGTLPLQPSSYRPPTSTESPDRGSGVHRTADGQGRAL